MVNTRQCLCKAGSWKLRCESKVGGKRMRCQLHAQQLFRQCVWMNLIVLPYTELLFVLWYQGKDSCNYLLLQSALCKTLLEEELSLICGNIFEGSGKYPWFNFLGTITYLVCKTAYCWPVPIALPRLTLHLCFWTPSLLLNLLGSMPIIRF